MNPTTHSEAQSTDKRGRLAWLPIFLLLAAIIVARVAGLSESYKSETLTLILGFIFYTLVSLGTLFLIGRSFLTSGSPGLLLLECGVVLWSLAGTVGDFVSHGDANINVTIFNIGISLAGMCHLAGAILALNPQRVFRRKAVWLAAGCAFALGALWLVSQGALSGWLPVFFIPGLGGTLVRYAVLISAIAMFVLSAGVLHANQRTAHLPFTSWYKLALLLLAVGLFGIMIQLSLGSVVNWLSRTAQWLGGLYLLIAAVASLRESDLPLFRVEQKSHRAYYRDAVAVVVVLTAAAIRLAFLSAMGTHAPYVVFFPAVVFASIYGGLRPGLLATAVSAILGVCFWIEPVNQFVIAQLSGWLSLAIFLLSGAMIAWVADSMHRARARASAAETQALLAEEREKTAEAQNRIQEAVSRIFEKALTCDTEEELGRMCLSVVEELTGSKFSFIGEIGKDGWLHDIAISDLGWGLCTMYDKTGHRRPPGSFRIHGLYGRVLLDGRSLLVNDPSSHPDSIGTPEGHPQLTAFLGVPFVQGGKTIGMVAVGNRERGYIQDQQHHLEAVVPVIFQTLFRKRADEALRESEERFRILSSATFEGIGISERGRIIDANEQLAHIMGSTRAELVGQEVAPFVAPGDRDRVMADILNGVESHTEHGMFRRNGTPIIVETHGRKFAYQGRQVRITAIRDITEHKRAEEALQQRTEELQHLTETLEAQVRERTVELSSANKALEESQSRLQFLSSSLLEFQEEERKRLSREVHDSFSSSLSAIKYRLEFMQGKNGPNEDLENLKSQVQVLIDESRRLQMALRPSMLDDLGIVSALGWFTREFQKNYSCVEVTSEIDVDEQEIPNQVKIPIFRICQEAFNNAAKHSQANCIKLSVSKLASFLRLEIQDNGVGVGAEVLEAKEGRRRGLGLLSMEERASLSGGFFTIRSGHEKGTTIRVSWPLSSIPTGS